MMSSSAEHLPILYSSSLLHMPPPEISTLSLHDALPISGAVIVRDRPRHHGGRCPGGGGVGRHAARPQPGALRPGSVGGDRKSTRLNSSHTVISYAVFCLKKKNIARVSTEVQADGLNPLC